MLRKINHFFSELFICEVFYHRVNGVKPSDGRHGVSLSFFMKENQLQTY